MDKEKIGEWIDGIIEDLTKPEIKLENILRKTKVLAFKIKNDQLKKWVNSELNGYQDYHKVPDYRKIPAGVQGNLIQQYGRCIITKQSLRLPIELLDCDAYSFLSTLNLTLSIAEMETFILDRYAVFSVDLTYHMTKKIQKLIKNFNIQSAWRVGTANDVVGVLSKIKNELLSFLLELNEEIGGDKELSIMSKKNKVDEIFKNTIGSINAKNVNISLGDNSNQTITNDNGKTEITQNNENNYKDEELTKDLKELLGFFRNLVSESVDEIQYVDELNSELNRLEVQSNKEKPKRNIVKQVLGVLKTMTINIASNASTESIVNKIDGIIKMLLQNLS